MFSGNSYAYLLSLPEYILFDIDSYLWFNGLEQELSLISSREDCDGNKTYCVFGEFAQDGRILRGGKGTDKRATCRMDSAG